MANSKVITKEFTDNGGNPTLMIWDKTNNTLGYADMTEPVKVASVDNCVREGGISLGASAVGLGGVSLSTDVTERQAVPNCDAKMAKSSASSPLRDSAHSCYQLPTSISFGVCAIGMSKGISFNSGWQDDRSAPVCQPG